MYMDYPPKLPQYYHSYYKVVRSTLLLPALQLPLTLGYDRRKIQVAWPALIWI